MNHKQTTVYAYIQKQYEMQVRIYSMVLEKRPQQEDSSRYYEGFMDGHFNGGILQLEMLANSNKLGVMGEELRALYDNSAG